ncbi:MAG: GTP-binding protein [Clostridia bacterium]|nr:GTP-binding protein [Clostridia bacterium]
MTKIDIFSGFLGAGKTTLIKKMIAEAFAGENLVLIENEFGEIGIDGGFLQDSGIKINEMNSGCICCSLVGDFSEALKKVLDQYHPDRIIIEPSGVGKLSDVIRAVKNAGTEGAELNSFTTVVDVNKCKMYMKNFGEFFNDQIENAGCIILSHTGNCKDAKLDEAVSLIREHNAGAVLVTTDWAVLDGKAILEAMERKDTLEAELKRLAEEDEHEHHHHHHHHDDDDEHECCCGHHHHHDDDDEDEHEHHHHHHHDDDDEDEHEHHHHHHHHDDDDECDDPDCCCHDHHGHHHHHHADEVFTSWGTETSKKFTADEITAVLEKFAAGEEFGMILRAKGIVAGADGKWIHFDYVPGEPDVRTGSAGVTGRLCVIGAKLKEDEIADLFGVK